MLNYILLGLGRAIGGISRFRALGFIANRYWLTFPWGTPVVNVTASFLIGPISTLTVPEGRWLVGRSGRNLFTAGVCGRYTTISSFSQKKLTLAQDEEWFYAGANAALNLILCLLPVWFGHIVAEVLNPTKGA